MKHFAFKIKPHPCPLSLRRGEKDVVEKYSPLGVRGCLHHLVYGFFINIEL
jgi:hypothetical protein